MVCYSVGAAASGVVVAVVVVEVTTGMVSGVEVAETGVEAGGETMVDVVVVVVGVMIGGGKSAASGVVVAAVVVVDISGISEMIVGPRCLLSHSATAVTPSCHDP